MASSWDSVLPSLITSIFDKAVLGGVLVIVGYWFQKRLELFKRDQALASELAKARIAAYHRAFSALAACDGAARVLLHFVRAGPPPASDKEKRDKAGVVKLMKERFDQECFALSKVLESDSYLLGSSFAGAVALYRSRLIADVAELRSDTPPDRAVWEEKEKELQRLREAMERHLPPFARIPAEDLHFISPGYDAVYLELIAKEQQGLKK